MTETTTHAADAGDHHLATIRRMLRIAWLGALLGLSIELLLLAIQAWQNALPDAVKIGADTVQKIMWS